MKRALVLFAVLQPLFTPPAFGGGAGAKRQGGMQSQIGRR
jgi:hypothetical protein